MKQIVFILFLCGFFLSCDKEEYSEIPYAPVRLDLDLGLEDLILQTPTGYKTFTQKRTEADMLGYGGILVCHGLLESNNTYNLWAFDMACPVEAQGNIRIVPEDSQHSGSAIEATCPKCGAKFNLIEGGIATSGSKFNLVRYKVSPLDGNKRFRITN